MAISNTIKSAASAPRNILITGVSGYVGLRLSIELSRRAEINSLVGTDVRPPADSVPKLIFRQRSILDSHEDILRVHQIDGVVHLAFIVKPTHKKMQAGRVDIEGAERLLEACDKTAVRSILYLSSHTVYGAFRDNPSALSETAPLRALRGFQYAEDKIKVEGLLQKYSLEHPAAVVTVLRACPVIGPGAARTISTVMMQMPLMMRLKGYDPGMQFVHEDDLIEVMTQFVLHPSSGAFNLAGDGEVKYSEIANMAGKKMITLPEAFVRSLMAFTWKLQLQNQSPPAGLEFIKYPPLVSTAALRDGLNYHIRHSSREAVAAYLSGVPGRHIVNGNLLTGT
jgi:UDP-glucose 4-epimerase